MAVKTAKCPVCKETISQLKYYKLKAEIETGTYFPTINKTDLNLVDFTETKFLCPFCNAILALNLQEAQKIFEKVTPK